MKIWLEPFTMIDGRGVPLVAFFTRIKYALTQANYSYNELDQLLHDAAILASAPNKQLDPYSYAAEVNSQASIALNFKQKYIDFMTEFESDLGSQAEWCLLFEDFDLNFAELGEVLETIRRHKMAFTAYLAVDDLYACHISELEGQFAKKWRWVGESWVHWITDTQLRAMRIVKGIPSTHHAYSIASPAQQSAVTFPPPITSSATFPTLPGQPVMDNEQPLPKPQKWRSIDDE